jgi:hypothetical protein
VMFSFWNKAPLMFRSELVAVDPLSGERQAHDGEVKRLGDTTRSSWSASAELIP